MRPDNLLRLARPALVLSVVLLCAPSAFAVAIGQVDDFEDGSTEGWTSGGPHPAPPTSLTTGGPAGAGDAFLRLTSVGGSGAGSRLTVQNFGQWSGDYTAAGVTGIRIDVLNLGATDLSLRLLFTDPFGGPLANTAFSTLPIVVFSGSGWQSVFFAITSTDLTATLGTAAGALSGATELRLFHNPAPGFPGPGIAAVLGVDNLRAVPEPAAWALAALALCALFGARSNRV